MFVDAVYRSLTGRRSNGERSMTRSAVGHLRMRRVTLAALS